MNNVDKVFTGLGRRIILTTSQGIQGFFQSSLPPIPLLQLLPSPPDFRSQFSIVIQI